jgi:glutamate carboxypeptidase
MRIDGGRAYGAGISDMKAGIILALHCLEALVEVGLGVDAQLLMTSDEEIGSRTSRGLIAELARPGRPVLVLEPPLPGGVLKLERKGTATIEITVRGRSAHAGVEPEAGASAVEEAASVCRRLVALRTSQDEGSSLVIGTLSGGTASNVVAAEATMQLDLRAWSNQSLEALTAAVLELTTEDPRVNLSFSVSGARPPLVRQPASDQLLARFRRHAARAGLDVDAGRTGGASDGNLAQSYGATVLDGLGLRGAGAHAEDEHIELDHIVPHAFALASLLHELSCA